MTASERPDEIMTELDEKQLTDEEVSAAAGGLWNTEIHSDDAAIIVMGGGCKECKTCRGEKCQHYPPPTISEVKGILG